MPSRKPRNRRHRSEHGNLKVVVANITALSNLKLALVGEPDVALGQEPWASRSEVAAEAKRLGYTAAMGAEEPCMATVLFRPGRGQQLHLQSREGWQGRTAAAITDLGGGFRYCVASVYGHTKPTIGQKKVLSGVIEDVVGNFRSRG